jgi:hypothetical protein
MNTFIVRASCVLALASLAAGCFPPVIGDDDDGFFDTDAYDPDLVVNSFTFTDVDSPGTTLDFQDIELCNFGDVTAEPGYEYAVLLSQSPDLSGDYYVLFESAPMVGVAAWDCVYVEESVAVGAGVPEGYYYVIVYVDYLDSVTEYDESNNWSLSDDAIYVVPGASELR